MPIYEYTCKEGHHFEKMESFSASKIKKCPECGKKAERILSLAAFHLKGSGWYAKDSAANTKAAKGTTTTETSSDSKESSTDKKTEKADKPEKSDKKSDKKTEKKAPTGGGKS